MLITGKFSFRLVTQLPIIDDEDIIREKIALLHKQVSQRTCKELVFSFMFMSILMKSMIVVHNRCRELKKLNCNAFVTFNIDNEQTKRLKV